MVLSFIGSVPMNERNAPLRLQLSLAIAIGNDLAHISLFVVVVIVIGIDYFSPV